MKTAVPSGRSIKQNGSVWMGCFQAVLYLECKAVLLVGSCVLVSLVFGAVVSSSVTYHVTVHAGWTLAPSKLSNLMTVKNENACN